SRDLAAFLHRRHRPTPARDEVPDRRVPGRTFRAPSPRHRRIYVQPVGPCGAGGGDPTVPASYHARPAFGAGGGAPGAAAGLEPFGRDAPGLAIAPRAAFAIVAPLSGVSRGINGGRALRVGTHGHLSAQKNLGWVRQVHRMVARRDRPAHAFPDDL